MGSHHSHLGGTRKRDDEVSVLREFSEQLCARGHHEVGEVEAWGHRAAHEAKATAGCDVGAKGRAGRNERLELLSRGDVGPQ